MNRCTLCGERVNPSTAFRDKVGRLWCEQHQKRGWLTNYGARHRWPTITFGSFAIGYGNDASLWTIPTAVGRDEMIELACQELELTGEEIDEYYDEEMG